MPWARPVWPPEQVLFVGDSTVHDIEGPAAVGMRTAWLVADGKGGELQTRAPDFVIETLGEVADITARARCGMTARQKTPLRLKDFLDERLGDRQEIAVEAMRGGGSCEIFSVGAGRRELGAAPRAAARELADRARRAARVPHPRRHQGAARRDRPAGAFLRRQRGFRGPVLRDGPGRRGADPRSPAGGLGGRSRAAGRWRSSSSSTRSSPCTPSTGRRAGSAIMAHVSENYLQRQISRWLAQLHSYGGRELAVAEQLAAWLESTPPARPAAGAVSR